MPDKFEIQGLLGATEKVVFLLHTVELTLEYVDRVHGGIGTHVALHRTRLNPFLQYVIDLVLYDFVFGDNLELKTSCADNTDVNDEQLATRDEHTELFLDRVILPLQNFVV